jgi:hypothetical protein
MDQKIYRLNRILPKLGGKKPSDIFRDRYNALLEKHPEIPKVETTRTRRHSPSKAYNFVLLKNSARPHFESEYPHIQELLKISQTPGQFERERERELPAVKPTQIVFSRESRSKSVAVLRPMKNESIDETKEIIHSRRPKSTIKSAKGNFVFKREKVSLGPMSSMHDQNQLSQQPSTSSRLKLSQSHAEFYPQKNKATSASKIKLQEIINNKQKAVTPFHLVGGDTHNKSNIKHSNNLSERAGTNEESMAANGRESGFLSRDTTLNTTMRDNTFKMDGDTKPLVSSMNRLSKKNETRRSDLTEEFVNAM